MKKSIRIMVGFVAFVAVLMALVSPVLALNDANDYVRNGTTIYDKGSILDVTGTLKINGTAVTATAAQLNAAGSGTVTNGQLSPLVVSNANLEVMASNVTVSTAITLPAGSVAAASLAGNIAVARITNAANTVGASIGGNIPVAAITNAANTVGASIGGNIPAVALTNAVIATIQPAYASGKFVVVDTTNLAFIASGVTNILDTDITTP